MTTTPTTTTPTKTADRRAGPEPLTTIMLAVAGMLAAAAVPIDGTVGGRVRAATAESLPLDEEEAFRAAAGRVAASVVRVETAGASVAALGGSSEANPGSGPSSGLIVDPDGWIVATSFAVPADAREAIVMMPGQTEAGQTGAGPPDGTNRLVARVVGRDLARGLVLLKVEGTGPLPVPEAAAKRELAVGQWAIALGRSWDGAKPSVAVGILSATNRAWGRAVQTDASVSPANYGGPLVDIGGRVIGILAPLPADTAGMNMGTELYDSGIGFAVPMEDVARVLPRLKQGETLAPGILGISYRSRDLFTAEAAIATVRAGSPAARAGLRAGDLIVEADGLPVTRIAQVRHALAPRYAGDTLGITVERRIGDAPPTRVATSVTLADALPPWRRPVIGLVPGRTGGREAAAAPVVVDWVWPDGPAAKAGIAAGDVIETVTVVPQGPAAAAAEEAGAKEGDQRTQPLPIDSPAALAGIIAGTDIGGKLSITVLRDGKRSTLDLATVAAPDDMPQGLPNVPWSDRQPAAGPVPGGTSADAATVTKLESPETPKPPLVVLPTAAGQPLAVLVYFGPPHGPVEQGEAAAWKKAAARHGVAVILPGSGDPHRWSRADVAAVARSLDSLRSKRAVDSTRVAVAGTGPGGAFAWLVAEALGPAVRGVALLDSGLPRQATIDPAEPGRSRWVLFGHAGGQTPPKIEADRKRLEQAGFPVGMVPLDAGKALPTETLCGWVEALGLL